MNSTPRPMEMLAPSGETSAERLVRRGKLVGLDRCLDLLEGAMERDRSLIDARDAAILAETTTMVHEGMAVADAIEVVLLLQEAYMLPLTRRPEHIRPALDVG
jgi:hypothetical protein